MFLVSFYVVMIDNNKYWVPELDLLQTNRHQFTLPDHGYGASASRGVPVYVPAFAGTHCTSPRRDGQAELAWVAGYIPRWFTRLQTVTHPSTNRDRRWLTSLMQPTTLLTTGFPCLLQSPGFFLNSSTRKVLENHFGSGMFWKSKLKVMESPKKISLKVMHFSSGSSDHM